MKRVILASVLSLVLLVAFVPKAKAQMAKEGTYSGTYGISVTILKTLAMGKERVQVNYEYMGAYTSDTRQGFLHNSSIRGIGTLHAVKGIFKGSGFHVATDLDGDQAFYVYKSTGTLGHGEKGTITWVGGTGKYSGLQGSGEFTFTPVRPATEGTIQGIVKEKGHWKLP